MKFSILFLSLVNSIYAFGQDSVATVNMDSLTAKAKCFFVIGSGGGFTGQEVKYYVFSSGQVYREDKLAKKSVLVKTIPKNEVKGLFKKLKSLNLEKMDFKHPGNMTYTLEKHSKGKEHTITWGDRAAATPPEVADFYKMVMEKISTQ